jgi:hypothetical protein
MDAVFAFHTGKVIVQITTVEIEVNHLLKIRPPESVLSVQFSIKLNRPLYSFTSYRCQFPYSYQLQSFCLLCSLPPK